MRFETPKLPDTLGNILSEKEVKGFVSSMEGVFGDLTSKMPIEDGVRYMPVICQCQKARERLKIDFKELAKELKVPQYRLREFESLRMNTESNDLLRKYIARLGLEEWFFKWCQANPNHVLFRPKQPSRKLKLDKRFKPLPSEEGEEFYPNGYFEFNVSKMLDHIRAHPEEFVPEEVDVDALSDNRSDDYHDEQTVLKADLSVPIVLAEIAPEQFNVIDGNHRLERARREKRKTIAAYKMGPEHHTRFLTTEKAYRAYVNYWNDKVEPA